MSDKKFNGIRAEGEGDRPESFKLQRNKLMDSVNNWLSDLEQMRNDGKTLVDGMIILDRPRIVRSKIGKTAMGMYMASEERSPGISLTGDNIMTPLHLQAVVRSKTGKGFDMIEVIGTDPLARSFRDDSFQTEAAQETVVSFKQTDISDHTRSDYFSYEIKGNGSIYREFLSPDGIHTRAPIRTVDEIEMASTAFDRIKTALV